MHKETFLRGDQNGAHAFENDVQLNFNPDFRW